MRINEYRNPYEKGGIYMYLVYILHAPENRAGFLKIERLSNLQYQLQQSGLLDQALFFPVDGLKDAKLLSTFANMLLENDVLPQ